MTKETQAAKRIIIRKEMQRRLIELHAQRGSQDPSVLSYFSPASELLLTKTIVAVMDECFVDDDLDAVKNMPEDSIPIDDAYSEWNRFRIRRLFKMIPDLPEDCKLTPDTNHHSDMIPQLSSPCSLARFIFTCPCWGSSGLLGLPQAFFHVNNKKSVDPDFHWDHRSSIDHSLIFSETGSAAAVCLSGLASS